MHDDDDGRVMLASGSASSLFQDRGLARSYRMTRSETTPRLSHQRHATSLIRMSRYLYPLDSKSFVVLCSIVWRVSCPVLQAWSLGLHPSLSHLPSPLTVSLRRQPLFLQVSPLSKSFLLQALSLTGAQFSIRQQQTSQCLPPQTQTPFPSSSSPSSPQPSSLSSSTYPPNTSLSRPGTFPIPPPALVNTSKTPYAYTPPHLGSR